jgi:predicted RNA-binding Zn-ribbon protein involved in translation (DUF1610 family)
MSSITSLITDGQVTGDLTCTECGYNLRTLSLTASCPECGMTVITSTRGDHLLHAPQLCRRNLTTGARLLNLSVLLAFPLVYPGVALSGLALWLLTRKQSGRDEPALDRGYRLAARGFTVLGGALIVCLALGALIALASGRQRLFEDWRYNDLPVFDLLFLLGHAIWILGLLATWRYLRVLALRVPDDALADAFNKLTKIWFVSIPLIAGAIGALIGLNRWGILPGAAESPSVAIIISLPPIAILFGLWVATLRTTARQATTFRSLSQNV